MHGPVYKVSEIIIFKTPETNIMADTPLAFTAIIRYNPLYAI